jgi:hypothetical protein
VFVVEADAALDLAGCTTANGHPCESPTIRPDNAPICPVLSPDGGLAWVTLRGGGLFVVDALATPMRIVGEYDRETVHPNGCGGIVVAGSMYLNSGAGGLSTNPSEFDVYRFPLTGYVETNAPNQPAPAVLLSRDDEPDRDAHGMQATGGGRYIWAFDRAKNVAEVIATATGAHVGTFDLRGEGVPDPTPDLSDASPDGNRVFVTFRGPNPLSGDAHVATGSTPGLGVYAVQAAGRRGALIAHIPISNIDANGIERADPHGIAVRLLR